MNRTTAKTIWKAVILILILMSVSLVMFQTIQISGSQSEHINDLSRGWYYIQEGEKTEITLPAEIKSTDKVILYHENVENYQKEFLMFKGAEYQPVIYAGDCEIYRYDDEGVKRNNTVLNNMICMVEIPEGITGLLEIHFSPDGEGSCRIPAITAGTWKAQIRNLLARNIYSILMNCILLSMGILLLGLSLVMCVLKMDGKRLRYISGFLIVCSMWGLTDSPFIQFLFVYDEVIINANFYFFMLIVTPMMRYIRTIPEMQKYRTLSVFIYFAYFNIIMQSVLVYTEKFTFFELLPITHIFYVVGIITIIIMLLKEKRKSKNRDLIVCLKAFAAEGITGAVTIILYAMKFPLYQNLFQIGILLFVLILLYNLAKELVQNMKYRTEADIYRRLSEEDKLTGLKNRRAFDLMLQNIEKNRNDYKEAVMIFSDLNGLKYVNDHFGHAQGDRQIIGAAECIRKAFGELGYCYRIGGDEFCVIITNAVEKDEYEARLCDEIHRYNNENKSVHELSVAYGVSSISREDGTFRTVAEWKNEADRKMYLNKQEGKAGRR